MASTLPTDRYLEPHQARTRQPTPYEDLLGDSIERGFAAGVSDLRAMVEHLNATGPSCENGQPWTEQSFAALMARLGH